MSSNGIGEKHSTPVTNRCMEKAYKKVTSDHIKTDNSKDNFDVVV